MDTEYELKLVNSILTKQKEREHVLETQACSGQLEYVDIRERVKHEFEWRDIQVIIRALENYKQFLKNA